MNGQRALRRAGSGSEQAGVAGGARRRPERAFVLAALWALALTAALTLPASYVLAGPPGLRGAAAALAFLAVLFGVSSVLHVLAAPYDRSVWLVLTVGGLGLRLVLYVALVRSLGEVASLSGTALGLSAATGIVVGHVFELRALVRAREGAPGSASAPGGAGLEGVDR